MYHETLDCTSPILVSKAAQAARILEKAFESPLPITREDDWRLVQAYSALQAIVQNNDNGVLS